MLLWGKTTYRAPADAPKPSSKSFGQAPACSLVEDFIALFTLPSIKGLNPFFKSRNLFFQRLREGEYQDFTSALEANLERE